MRKFRSDSAPLSADRMVFLLDVKTFIRVSSSTSWSDLFIFNLVCSKGGPFFLGLSRDAIPRRRRQSFCASRILPALRYMRPLLPLLMLGTNAAPVSRSKETMTMTNDNRVGCFIMVGIRGFAIPILAICCASDKLNACTWYRLEIH